MQLIGFQPYSDGRMEAEFTSPKARKRKTKGRGRQSTQKRTREVSEEESEDENNESEDHDDDGLFCTVTDSLWKGRSRSTSDEDEGEIVISGVVGSGRSEELKRVGGGDRNNNNRSKSSPPDRTTDNLEVSNAQGYLSDREVPEGQLDLCGAQATHNRLCSGADNDSPVFGERVSTPASARLHSLNPYGDVGDRQYPTDELALMFDRESPLTIRSKADLFEEPSDVFLSGGTVKRQRASRSKVKKRSASRNDDTDLEEGDDEEFTTIRRKRKAERILWRATLSLYNFLMIT